jgi:hypothetical protein
MHDVDALIAHNDALTAGASRFVSAVVCPLAQGFSLLPITDALTKELAAYRADVQATLQKAVPQLPPGAHALAIEISHSTPVAYISTTYFGGHGTQDALVWAQGDLRFSRDTPGYDRPWPHTPISQALRAIGVVADQGLDEFDTVGLGKHRETHRWAASVK